MVRRMYVFTYFMYVCIDARTYDDSVRWLPYVTTLIAMHKAYGIWHMAYGFVVDC